MIWDGVPVALALLSFSDAAPNQLAHKIESHPKRVSPSVAVAAEPRNTEGVADLIQRLASMSKADRAKAIEKLEPAKRQRIENGLRHIDNLGPAEKQRILDQYRRFASLDPQRKKQLRTAIFEFHTLPEDRRLLVRKEIDAMHTMSKAQLQQTLNSEQFKTKFTPEERSIIERTQAILPNF